MTARDNRGTQWIARTPVQEGGGGAEVVVNLDRPEQEVRKIEIA